ncbi:MAG: radical SAM protein [Desulfoprunum sp.]|nr:radical SAM protein [Desulfoprunum sp.]
MIKFLGQVESVCPECLKRLTGRLVGDGDVVRLEKTCPEHGSFSATVWRGEPPFLSWFRPKLPFSGGSRRPTGRGCPLDCGLCEDHGQRTCTALVEITSRCNLGCPVCFADSGGSMADPDPATLDLMFARIITQTGGCNLQLSGGEPTIRPDLPQIVGSARKAGFTFIQLNSNGLAFASDPELAVRLRDEGLSSVFLQFDGVRDEVFATLRGRKLLAEKRRAIDNLAAAGLGIVLVPTVARGVNTDQLWEVVRFGLDRQPHVRGVHFQPMSYLGRFPATFRPDHVTLPEIMSGLCNQSQGLLNLDDFRPPGCEHALCSFSAKYLVQEDGRLQRLGSTSCDCTPKPAEEGALTSIAITARQWGRAQESSDTAGSEPDNDLDHFLRRARSHTFSISAMAFQDAWSLNLERLKGCCIHVAQPDGRLIPFCSFNLTARDGRSLNRSRRPQATAIKRTPVDGLVAARLGIGTPLCRDELERSQLEALRRTIRHARANSPLYRERLAGLEPNSLLTLADLARLPLLTGSDIASQGHRLLSVSQSLVHRVITLQTSGSTGVPKRLSFTAADLAATSEFFLHGMHSLVGNDDRLLVLLPFAQPDSVGDLLIRALQGGGIEARGMWPPESATDIAGIIRQQRLTCVVGLPQHLLALAEEIGPGLLKSMLLCSDYAAPALRSRIEAACGCETFLHYGATESGLGGAVECSAHKGCHIRESELLVEIVDPCTGNILSEGEAGEVVLTTLGRKAMPLIRYRTGDMATLDRSPCPCGGVTARLTTIRGRLAGCLLPGGGLLYSQDLDDLLFRIPGLLDYRVTMAQDGMDRLQVDFVAVPGKSPIEEEIRRMLLQLPAVRESFAGGKILIGMIRRVASFAATHTVKRTILDQRNKGEVYAAYS